MKKIFQISFFCLYILVFYSCKPDCSGKITPAEEAFIPYKQGEKAFFNNDSTGIIDTLLVYGKDYIYKGAYKCADTPTGIYATVDFSAIKYSSKENISIQCSHNSNPSIHIAENNFIVNAPPQTIAINNVTYNDVYSISVDSNKITNATYPWKINYSKSKGFVRFYMKKGITWSKL